MKSVTPTTCDTTLFKSTVSDLFHHIQKIFIIRTQSEALIQGLHENVLNCRFANARDLPILVPPVHLSLF